MNFDKLFLDTLTERAQLSERRRMNYDLRDSENDLSQKMLNALEPDTVLPVHRHLSCSESVVMLRGSAIQYIYSKDGTPIEAVYLVAAGASHPYGTSTNPSPQTETPQTETPQTETSQTLRAQINHQLTINHNDPLPEGIQLSEPCPGMMIPKAVWHKIVSLESGTVLMESKNTPYSPLSPEELWQTKY